MHEQHDIHAATIVSLHSRLLALKLMPRTGWLQRGQATPESIAEHTFGVASLALLVGAQVPDIERGRLLEIALLHDMAEALTGDLPASARRLFGKAAKQAAEHRAMVELFGPLPHAEAHLALWDDYCQQASREARLVKQLDRLEMLAQALLYERSGSRAMAEFWEDAAQGWSAEFPLVEAMALRLLDERRALHSAQESG